MAFTQQFCRICLNLKCSFKNSQKTVFLTIVAGRGRKSVWNITFYLDSSRTGVDNSNLMVGPKIVFWHFQGPKLISLITFKGFFVTETSKINKKWGFAGQIKRFCGPHLACGPYVVHACSRTLANKEKKNIFESLKLFPSELKTFFSNKIILRQKKLFSNVNFFYTKVFSLFWWHFYDSV